MDLAEERFGGNGRGRRVWGGTGNNQDTSAGQEEVEAKAYKHGGGGCYWKCQRMEEKSQCVLIAIGQLFEDDDDEAEFFSNSLDD